MKKLIDLIFPDIAIDMSRDFNTWLDYIRNKSCKWIGMSSSKVRLPK
jgi:hypothetical protein